MLLCPVVQGAWDADAMVNKLLQVGADAIEAEQQRRQKAAQEAQPVAENGRQTSITTSLLDVVLAEYKEAGRAYARELGDLLIERVRKDEQIQSSVRTVQMLCWGVIIYLTVVTLVMLFSLLHIQKINRQLLRDVQELQKRLP